MAAKLFSKAFMLELEKLLLKHLSKQPGSLIRSLKNDESNVVYAEFELRRTKQLMKAVESLVRKHDVGGGWDGPNPRPR